MSCHWNSLHQRLFVISLFGSLANGYMRLLSTLHYPDQNDPQESWYLPRNPPAFYLRRQDLVASKFHPGSATIICSQVFTTFTALSNLSIRKDIFPWLLASIGRHLVFDLLSPTRTCHSRRQFGGTDGNVLLGVFESASAFGNFLIRITWAVSILDRWCPVCPVSRKWY